MDDMHLNRSASNRVIGHSDKFLAKPLIPGLHALTGLSRDLQRFDIGIDFPGKSSAPIGIETNMRQKVHLINQHQPACTEHVQVFGRFVVALGNRQHHDFGPLARIEQRRTHQVAHILNQNQRARTRILYQFAMIPTLRGDPHHPIIAIR